MPKFPKSIYLVAEWLGHTIWSCSTLLGNANCISKVVVPTGISPTGMRVPTALLQLWLHLVLLVFLAPVQLVDSLGRIKKHFNIIVHFLCCVGDFFLFIHISFLYTLDTNPLLVNHGSENIFSQLVVCLIPLLMASFLISNER